MEGIEICWFGGLYLTAWRERNGRSFEDSERNIVELKLLFFRTLVDWVVVRGFISCNSLHQFLDFCPLQA